MAVPLIASSPAQVAEAFGELRGSSKQLAGRFWPGPLSLILDAPPWMTPAVHGGRETAAVRVPDHSVACALAAAFGRPVTATSANRSGAPPAADAGDLAWLADNPRVFVIDGGATRGGAPSTIVDARGDDPICVRAGAIAWDRVLTSR
jgi:L-threonylcarbamoyladenylate synthase